MKTIKTWNDLMNTIAEDIESATDAELLELANRLDTAMQMLYSADAKFSDKQISTVQDMYWAVSGERDERYRNANAGKVQAYFNEHFAGKTEEEIFSDAKLTECWGFYSDWHKDCYGYRPHGVVCGVYVNPHTR